MSASSSFKPTILIIGAGVGGLSSALALSHAGFATTVFESAGQLGEVGAGINITPNLARVLERFGVLDVAANEATPLEGARIIRAVDDQELSYASFSHIQEMYSHPFLTVHRAALQKSLKHGCETSGLVTLRLGQTITGITFDPPSISYRSAKDSSAPVQTLKADLILAADGVKSYTRSQMLKLYGEDDHVEDTGQSAYRIMLTKEQMYTDPELKELIDSNISYRWIGHKRHIIAYPIANHQIFNLSTANPDDSFENVDSESWTTRGSKSQLLKMYQDFCPRVQKMLNLVEEDTKGKDDKGGVCEWKLRVHAPLTRWVVGGVALVGDACHPTLPHLAQGAAQAVEDAAVIGVVMSKIKSVEEIPRAMRVYQLARKARAEFCVAEAAANGRGLHVADGAEQAARDEKFKAASDPNANIPNPDKAADKHTQEWLYGHDCVKNAEEKFDELWAAAEEEPTIPSI